MLETRSTGSISLIALLVTLVRLATGTTEAEGGGCASAPRTLEVPSNRGVTDVNAPFPSVTRPVMPPLRNKEVPEGMFSSSHASYSDASAQRVSEAQEHLNNLDLEEVPEEVKNVVNYFKNNQPALEELFRQINLSANDNLISRLNNIMDYLNMQGQVIYIIMAMVLSLPQIKETLKTLNEAVEKNQRGLEEINNTIITGNQQVVDVSVNTKEASEGVNKLINEQVSYSGRLNSLNESVAANAQELGKLNNIVAENFNLLQNINNLLRINTPLGSLPDSGELNLSGSNSSFRSALLPVPGPPTENVKKEVMAKADNVRYHNKQVDQEAGPSTEAVSAEAPFTEESEAPFTEESEGPSASNVCSELPVSVGLNQQPAVLSEIQPAFLPPLNPVNFVAEPTEPQSIFLEPMIPVPLSDEESEILKKQSKPKRWGAGIGFGCFTLGGYNP